MKNYEEERLREEYTPKAKTSLDEARKIDIKAKLPAYITAYSIGIIGALVLGLGMCLAMKVIGDGTMFSFIGGIVIGLFGIVLVSVNYPLYLAIMRKRKARYASQILVTLNSEK